MSTLTLKTVTPADVAAGLTDSWCYSDAFKDINGFRPCGEYFNSPEYIAEFWNTFEEASDRVQEEERQQLAYLGEEHGRIFANWMAYYDFLDQRELEAAEAAEAERREQERLKQERECRFSVLVVVESWEEGAL